MKRFSFLIVLALSLALGCAKGGYFGSSKTECRVNPKFQSKAHGNGGCFIVSDGKMLVIRHKPTGKFDFPGGTAEKGETSQCTASRETKEETGNSVEVGKLLVNFEKIRLFDCKPLKKVRLKASRGVRDEVSEVLLIDPTKTKAKEWRYPVQHGTLTSIYKQQTRATKTKWFH
ncbi:MAG: NUDIX hydrolase [Deltaproteobacteria bacterium]|nr:NUDIX hydrolase [Deltaproteobacteria bacterium]